MFRIPAWAFQMRRFRILFQKFYRVREHESRASGTGLGLSICKQIVHGHGGRIEVKSKLGVGTVFMIYLPRSNKTIPRDVDARAMEECGCSRLIRKGHPYLPLLGAFFN
jgi:hypothetical protein